MKSIADYAGDNQVRPAGAVVEVVHEKVLSAPMIAISRPAARGLPKQNSKTWQLPILFCQSPHKRGRAGAAVTMFCGESAMKSKKLRRHFLCHFRGP